MSHPFGILDAVRDALDALGRKQYGLVTTGQLLSLGYSRSAMYRLVTAGRIVPVRLGVYRLCGVEPTWGSAALAAVLAAGAGAVLSHSSAAVLWRLMDRNRFGAPLQITKATQCRLVGVRTHRFVLGPGEITTHRRIPVTTVERTLLDLAQTECLEMVGPLLDKALRAGLTTMKRIERVWQHHAGQRRSGARVLGAALADRGVGYDPGANDWEQAMDRMWDRMGLPPARRQYRIRVAGGRSYKPDRAILDARIAVDWNGYEDHGTRSGFDYDSDRRARLAAAGWFPLDFTSRSDPLLICRTVLAVYEERRGQAARCG